MHAALEKAAALGPTAVAVERTRVFVVDDHPLMCAGLAGILSGQPDLEVVGFARSGAQAQTELRTSRVDLVVVDHDLGCEPNGPDLCRVLSGPSYGLACLGLSSSTDATVIREFLAAGARGVLYKDADRSHILEAVHTVAAGGSYLDPLLSAQLMQLLAPEDGRGTAYLTPLEQRVLGQMAHGCSNQAIAASLCISLSSAKLHVSHVLASLGVSTRTAAVALAARRGLLDPNDPQRSTG